MNTSGFHVTADLLADARVIEFGAYRLAAGARKFDLKRELAKCFDKDDKGAWIEPKDYENYLKSCRAALRQIADIDPKEMIQRLTVTLFDMLQDEDATKKDRVGVISELVKMYGLDKFKGGGDSAARIREFVSDIDS